MLRGQGERIGDSSPTRRGGLLDYPPHCFEVSAGELADEPVPVQRPTLVSALYRRLIKSMANGDGVSIAQVVNVFHVRIVRPADSL